MSVLVLQTFACKRCPSGSAAKHESAASQIAGGPDQIADSLESKHGIENEERDGIDTKRGVGRSCRNEGGHGSRFRNSLFQDLSVFCFLVVK